MDNATPETAAPSPLPPVCLFGLDDAGKPHASRFTGADAERATKAAGLMGLHVLALASPDSGDLADRLPQGRIFESGKAFVPFVARPLYERLAALGGIPVTPPAPKPEKVTKPAKAPEKAAPGKNAKPSPKAAKLAASTATPSPSVEASGVPLDWPHIREGSLVLATTGGGAEGWFESIVVEAKADDLMVLRWRDFADEALFLRRRDQLALLPAGTPLAAKA